MSDRAEAILLALKRIQAAEEYLSQAAGTQSLLRVHEIIERAARQIEGAKTILRAASQSPTV